MKMAAVKEAIAEAERFIKVATTLGIYKFYDGTQLAELKSEAEYGQKAAACKRASLDLTHSLEKMRRS